MSNSSSNDIKELFFSTNNLNFTYEQVKKKVARDVNYDISKNNNLKTNYNKMSLLVYNNTPQDQRNLVHLNNQLVEKSGNYFCNLVNNKRNSGNNNSNNNGGRTISGNSSQFGGMNNMNGNYNNQLKQQADTIPNGSPNMYMPPQQPSQQTMNQGGSQQSVQVNNNNVNVLPFTLSDEFINEVSNSDKPIYTNMASLESSENKDPMALMKQQESNRDIEMQRYTQQLEQLKQNSLLTQSNKSLGPQKSLEQQYQPNKMSIGRDDALIDTRIDNIEVDPLELYRKNEDLTDRMVASMDQATIGNNIALDINEKELKMNNDKHEILTQKTADKVNNQFYQNTKYSFDRRPAQLVVLQESFTGDGASINFKANLSEPLIIDGHSDIFLEFINLQYIDDGSGHMELINCFALDIDELPLNTTSNNEDLKDKYIIPNESFGLTDNSADGGNNIETATSYNIKLKSNYMCTINPMKLSTFTIKLYGLNVTSSNTLTLLTSNGANKASIVIGLYIIKHQ